ncbi:MAG: bifunctional diaminohydroxyphosphoribosylaminopyrimidine deaminase/5-amino-6-(5-phosphoribosylamino)uracil reductase RibD [Desulfovibrio sp.]|jgi:diaminohydroxyphosphoribosylaminopyrimidine deaminase/5-amino-6-(5-phosphoribosylamino)uracil reductase|nr:bifunctional diaminohydroxyphosphoribosylaminopyrimidine deaminase/5-amino-6-(5-phosphoribosylamino)uracil reductase RibD [Desulfovibrio sp.]
MPHADHPYFTLMLQAVELALEYKFRTRPNPCVGALLVKDGIAAAHGVHKGAGFPHAEVEVLEDAARKGVNPAECTMLVTMEPCRHQGRTPPCTEAILASGVQRLIVGTLDPNPEASGGAEFLRSRGLFVEVGIAEQECLDLIDDFITWQTTDLPYVLLKLAGTLDGRIAARTGHSRWISSPESREMTHRLRRHMQAVLVGGNTFYLDNPELTCRIGDAHLPEAGEEAQPLAVVATSRLPDAGQNMHLIQHRATKTIVWTTAAAAAGTKAEALRRHGVRVIGLPSKAGPALRGRGMRAELDIKEGLVGLRRDMDCGYVLCEGGGCLGLSLLDMGLAREFLLHLAPKILGDNEAVPIFDGRAPMHIDQALQLRITDTARCGSDVMLALRSARQHDAKDEGRG